jgi:hypothetical protein
MFSKIGVNPIANITKIAYSDCTCPVPAEIPPGEFKVINESSPDPSQPRTDAPTSRQSVPPDADDESELQFLVRCLREAKAQGYNFVFYDAQRRDRENGVMIIAKGVDSSILRVLLDEEKLHDP